MYTYIYTHHRATASQMHARHAIRAGSDRSRFPLSVCTHIYRYTYM